jgi:uncharacterized protein with PIN domain
MLGRLAKWLRLLGYDTLYAGRRPDHQIAALARAEGRIVLTRDRELTRRRGIRCLYVESQVLEEQLVQVIADLDLDVHGAPERSAPARDVLAHGAPAHDEERMGSARCPVCNQPLVRVSRQEVKPHVPAYVWKTQSLFHRCPACDRVYWPGTHWDHIEATISRVTR